MKRIRLAAAAVAAALTLAALAVTPPAASAASRPTTQHRVINGTLYLVNSPGHGAQMTANGDGGQAEVTDNGANLTESRCGTVSGQPVVAEKNANSLWMHYKTSNNVVTFERDTTNGCPNNADEWIRAPQGSGFIYVPLNDQSTVLGTASDSAGSSVFIGASPNWKIWNG